MKTIYVVTDERDGSGQLDWYYEREAAEQKFADAVFAAHHADGQYLALFELPVPNKAGPDQITRDADIAMWECYPCYVNAVLRCDLRPADADYGPSAGII
jgi:hypothetical protein